MSEQSLRDALEKLARGDVPLDTPASKFAREALAAHPAEPAPVCACLNDETGTDVSALCTVHNPKLAEPAGVSDEAVEAAAVAWAPFWATSTTDATRKAIRKRARKALEAAQPFMEPQVVASRCTNCDADTLACTACGARVEPWG